MHRLLACFGSAEFGRCGLGPDLLTSQLIPRVCVALAKYDIEAAAAGGAHTLALTKGGLVFSFGLNTSGQLGHSQGDQSVTVSEIPARTLWDDDDHHTGAVKGRCQRAFSGARERFCPRGLAPHTYPMCMPGSLRPCEHGCCVVRRMHSAAAEERTAAGAGRGRSCGGLPFGVPHG